MRGEQLRRALGLTDETPVPLSWVRGASSRPARRRGMLLDDADPDTHGVGSFFQNAIVTAAVAGALALPPECPRWPVAPDLDAVTVIPLASYDGQVPLSKPTTVSDVKVSASLADRAGGHPQGVQASALARFGLDQACAGAHEPRRRDRGRGRRARAVHPEPGPRRVRSRAAAGAGAGRRRPVGRSSCGASSGRGYTLAA